MTRRCSHCSNNGHNSRTCPTTKGVKLFGVRLTDGGSIIKKSASVGNLSHYYSSPSSSASPNSPPCDPIPVTDGYVSDDPAHTSCSSNCRGGTAGGGGGSALDRKKGTPWTEEEHKLFLLGLQKLGKGDWRGIARNFVISRTPTQVASHAQKYFIRQSNSTRRKRRSSLFDMVPDMPGDREPVSEEAHGMFQIGEEEPVDHLPTLGLSLDGDCEPMESTSHNIATEADETLPCVDSTPILPALVQTFGHVGHVPLPFWPSYPPPATQENGVETSPHHVLKPTAIHSKQPVNFDELEGMSKLSLGAPFPRFMEPSPLSLKLIGSSSRQSAFHANQPVNRSDLRKRDGNAIPAA